MRIRPVLLIMIVLFLSSCEKRVELSDIAGVWSFYSEELQYAEVLIDSFRINGMNAETGGMLTIPFEIKDDSLCFLDSDFSALIQIASDTMFYLREDTLTYTFCRLDDSLQHVYGKQNMTEEEFDRYWGALWERACSQHGERAYRHWVEENYNMSIEEKRKLDSVQWTEPLPVHPVKIE